MKVLLRQLRKNFLFKSAGIQLHDDQFSPARRIFTALKNRIEKRRYVLVNAPGQKSVAAMFGHMALRHMALGHAVLGHVPLSNVARGPAPVWMQISRASAVMFTRKMHGGEVLADWFQNSGPCYRLCCFFLSIDIQKAALALVV